MKRNGRAATTEPQGDRIDASGTWSVADHRTPMQGDVLSDTYRIEQVLGAGGMGVVLSARDLRLHRDVAIKTIRMDRLGCDETRERFLTEARALARVSHPNVVEVHAFGEWHGTPYFVMEYVPGRTLETLIREGTFERRPLEATIEVLDRVCDALDAIHAAGLLHGDVKPANVIVSRGGRVVLTDMGLARLFAQTSSDGSVWGTLDYMAPEVIRGTNVSPALAPRSDIYSLGCLAFEALTGQVPFQAERDAVLMELHVHVPPPRPSEVCPRVPASFDDVILRALEKEPSERTATPRDFAEALRRALRIARVGRPSILIADDNLDQRLMLEELISRALPDTEIELVPDGMRALEAVDRRAPAVAIIDLDMPGVNGVELAAYLRGKRETRKVPIIVLSGIGSSPDWRTLRSLGVDHFLVKPVVPSSLLSLLRELLDAPK